MSFPTSRFLIKVILAILKRRFLRYESTRQSLIANIKESTLTPILKKLEQNDCLK